MPQFSKTLARELNEIKSNPMTPDKSTMNKTEREIEEIISKSEIRLNLAKNMYYVSAKKSAAEVYQLYRKELYKLLEFVEQQSSLKGDMYFWKNTNGDIVDLYEQSKDNFTSSNEGNNEKE